MAASATMRSTPAMSPVNLVTWMFMASRAVKMWSKVSARSIMARWPRYSEVTSRAGAARARAAKPAMRVDLKSIPEVKFK